MDNQNNASNQASIGNIAPTVNGNIASNDNSNGKRSEKASQMVKASQKKVRNIILAIVAVAVGIILVGVLGKTNFVTNIINNVTGNDKFKVDTGYAWADAYAAYIKDYFTDFNLKRFDVSFVDFNFDGTPEMCLRFEDSNIKVDEKHNNLVVKVYQYNNKEVNETKGFYNSQFKLVYSSVTEQINWYIYINSSGSKYGAYTMMSKILSNKAKDSDIKATNEAELTLFNKTYLASDYKINYYEVKEAKFLDDFQVVVNRYKEYNEEAKKEKDKLADDTASWKSNLENEGVKTSITVNGMTLNFGDYKGEVVIRELGVNKRITKTITLKDGYLIVDGREIKYTAYPSFVAVSSGEEFTVKDNNKFSFGNDGAIYELEE